MDIKKQAKLLVIEIRKINPDFKLHQAYELLAQNAGFKDWNTYSAKLKQQREANERFRNKQEKK